LKHVVDEPGTYDMHFSLLSVQFSPVKRGVGKATPDAVKILNHRTSQKAMAFWQSTEMIIWVSSFFNFFKILITAI
jgi:hypothetical protein